MATTIELRLRGIRKRLRAGMLLSEIDCVTILDVRDREHLAILCRTDTYNGGVGLLWTTFHAHGKLIYVLVDENVDYDTLVTR